MMYFSGRFVYRLGRLQDSNSASSKGVTARREKPRILLFDRFKLKSTKTAVKVNSRKPSTAPRMIQTRSSIMVGKRVGKSSSNRCLDVSTRLAMEIGGEKKKVIQQDVAALPCDLMTVKTRER